MEHLEGNMFEQIPSSDAVLMKVKKSSRVLHLHNKFTCHIIIIIVIPTYYGDCSGLYMTGRTKSVWN